MQRKLLFRSILILVLVVVALWQLYPTYNLNRLKEKENSLIGELSNTIDLTSSDIRTALINQELESLVRSKSRSLPKDSLDMMLTMSTEISKLYERIDKTEPKAIKRGLDLQGGTYLVYEVDFQEFIQNLAKYKDAELEQLIIEIDNEAKSKDLDFFDVLIQTFEEKEIPLSKYFGKKGDNNRRIIEDLRTESEEAIGRSLEVLRNRIDQFGVSEPSIQKQGSRRIVVELAGIQDINRAKRIIGKTALLEFKLVRDWEDTWDVVQKIDKIVKNRRLGITDSSELSRLLAEETVEADSITAEKKIRDEKEIDLSELFGETEEGEADISVEGDTALSVDKDLFEENPFLSLFGNVRNLMAAPEQNMSTINRILNYPEVKEIIPGDSEFLWSSQSEQSVQDKSTQYYYLLMVKKEAELTGSLLENADVQVSSGDGGSMGAGQSEVHLTFNNEGAKVFSRVTGANVGKNLAIVLDDKIRSHPRIKEKIPYGNARIDGMANIEEARDLVVVLRAGSLPAKLEVIEERTVGPSLGRDSIQKGQYSAIVGLILVAIFMIIYYRMSGVIADLALFLNIIFLLAVLAAFHFTLTLPGVAGIILTIGMAVDANVLIFERIREELRTGKTIRASIDSGYSRAFTTILDANVTTLITALVLYQFGTGPIKGFAVTLAIGILASMFTAIVVTRLVFDYITSRWQIKKLSI
ncbi:protein translocase subunit SecD [candidate division KSB1 bacterium]|nr:protein translocase subunit SecD [candidate division KSB1 bacterium]